VFADLNYEGALENAEKSKVFATNPQYRALGIKVDTSDPESVQEMVNRTISEFGRIDYSVNSAGVRTSLFTIVSLVIDKINL
jgi:NAD(P)-dependent dehydrogenase (short-subunit alcohol dehydrogenase family)